MSKIVAKKVPKHNLLKKKLYSPKMSRIEVQNVQKTQIIEVKQ